MLSPNSRRSPCKHPKYYCFCHSSTTSNTLAGFLCSTIPPGIPIIDPVLYSSIYVPCPNKTRKTRLRASLWSECPDRYEPIASQSLECSLTRFPPICCQGFTATQSVELVLVLVAVNPYQIKVLLLLPCLCRLLRDVYTLHGLPDPCMLAALSH